MSKEYYIELIRQSGYDEAYLKDLNKLPENALQALAEKIGPKKRGRKGDVNQADDVLEKLKSKPLTLGSEVTFELFSGKGRQVSQGKKKGFFQGYKLYAVVEYYNEGNGQNEKKELDAFKL